MHWHSGPNFRIAHPLGTATKTFKSQKKSTQLLQGCVFGFGLLEDRDVGIDVFPESEEIVIGSAGLGGVTLHGEAIAHCVVGVVYKSCWVRELEKRLQVELFSLATYDFLTTRELVNNRPSIHDEG